MNACLRFLYFAWFIRGRKHRSTFKFFTDGEWVFVHADFIQVVQFIAQKFEDGVLIPWNNASFPELRKPPTPQSFEDAKKIYDYIADKCLNDQEYRKRGGLLEWK